jgi:hypothetical protein
MLWHKHPFFVDGLQHYICARIKRRLTRWPRKVTSPTARKKTNFHFFDYMLSRSPWRRFIMLMFKVAVFLRTVTNYWSCLHGDMGSPNGPVKKVCDNPRKVSRCKECQWGTFNEKPDNRRRCRWWDQNTSWRHFSSVDVAPRKRSCAFFYRIFPKIKHCLYRRPADFSYEKPMTYWELCFWCMTV